MPIKPTCGSQGDSTDDLIKVILAIWGVVGTIGSVAGFLAGATSVITILGISALALIWLSAAGAALATVITVFAFYWDRCLQDPDGLAACSAGVINDIVASFSTTSEQIFWFTAQHPRVDVVVKSEYWDLVQELALFVKCADDPDHSPIIEGFYHSDQVCAVELGSAIGAVVGGVVGIIAGVAIAAAIGCAGSGPFYILCLIVAILVAAIVAAIITYIGAGVGGGIAGGIAGTDEPPSDDSGNVLGVGDYVSTFGNLITYGGEDGARVYWFVDRTVLHGRSAGSPQFSYKDPDANLLEPACPSREVIT
jgi:uncharacterized membrane protein